MTWTDSGTGRVPSMHRLSPSRRVRHLWIVIKGHLLPVGTCYQEGVVFCSSLTCAISALLVGTGGQELTVLGQGVLCWEMYEEVINGKCLLSMRHSSHKGHDNSLHEGEHVNFILIGGLLFGRIRFSFCCSFE